VKLFAIAATAPTHTLDVAPGPAPWLRAGPSAIKRFEHRYSITFTPALCLAL